MFDHERLKVYQRQLDFLEWVTPFIDEVKLRDAPKSSELRRQLDRASSSVLLNIAEGNGRRRRQTRAKFFDDARGSTCECAACLDGLVAKRVCSEDSVRAGKQILESVSCMLTRLVEYVDQPPQ